MNEVHIILIDGNPVQAFTTYSAALSHVESLESLDEEEDADFKYNIATIEVTDE